MKAQVLERIPEWARHHVVLMGLRGSDAHGTKLPQKASAAVDDTDVFVVVRQPLEYYLSFAGYNKSQEHWDSAGEHLDILVYDIRKFMWLLSGGNPNVVSWLWNRPEDYLYGNNYNIGKALIEKRDLFVTKTLVNSLVGYARGQQKRMLSQNAYRGYMGEKRKMLVDRFGYDVKFAAHTIRLLFLAKEALTNKTVFSFRPERDLLMGIKSGKLPIHEVNRIVDEELEVVEELQKHTTLPDASEAKEEIEQMLITFFLYTADT